MANKRRCSSPIPSEFGSNSLSKIRKISPSNSMNTFIKKVQEYCTQNNICRMVKEVFTNKIKHRLSQAKRYCRNEKVTEL